MATHVYKVGRYHQQFCTQGRQIKCHRLTDSTPLAERDTMYHSPPAMTVCSIFIQKDQPDPDCCMFDRCACNYPKFDGQATETFLS